MTWEWSHTQEAYDYVEDQIWRMDKETLQTIWAEWQMYHYCDQDMYAWHDQAYAVFVWLANRMLREQLAEVIWSGAHVQRLCTNGGWEAWVCPYGCHLVPFSPPKEDDSGL